MVRQVSEVNVISPKFLSCVAIENSVQTDTTFEKFARGKEGESVPSMGREIENVQNTMYFSDRRVVREKL